MARQERRLLDNLDGSAAYWQYRYNAATYERKQPDKQADQNTDGTWIIFLGILVTMGFLGLLAATVIWGVL